MPAPAASLDASDLRDKFPDRCAIQCPDHLLAVEALGEELIIHRGRILANGDTVKLLMPRTEEQADGTLAVVPGFTQFDIISNVSVSAGTKGAFVVTGESHMYRRELRLPAEQCQVKVHIGPVGRFGG